MARGSRPPPVGPVLAPAWPAFLLVVVTLAACALLLIVWPVDDPAPMPEPAPRFEPVDFADLPGWPDSEIGAAWEAFRRSCLRIDAAARTQADAAPTPLVSACRHALSLGQRPQPAAVQAFFEDRFTPHRVVGAGEEEGLLTGYFEPELAGSREPTADFTVPVYRRPDDLVALADDLDRARFNDRLTAARSTAQGLAPYPTRQEIEEGALRGRGLELLYLADPVEAFILHVQGSGLVLLPDGTRVRLGYAGKNGHPYTSIGRILVERGDMALEDMSLEALMGWLRDNPERGRELMWQNRSFIFFRELEPDEAAAGPVGAQGVALTPGRSLAVDGSIHALGLPIWVVADDLDLHGESGFRRLMVAQDVGSAIRGAQRGDIFWGSGEAAGHVAGLTRHKGRFFVLLPREEPAGGQGKWAR